MQQIEHGIFLATGLIACGGIDGKTASQSGSRTLIPHLAHGAVCHLVDLIEICTGITTYQQHAEQVVDIADIIDVQGIDDLHAVHDHIIGIELGLQCLGCETPHALVVLHEIHRISRRIESCTVEHHLLRRQEITRDLHLLSLRSDQIESHSVVGMNIR